MNSHLTTKRLKYALNFESAENVRSSNVVEFEFQLCHISNSRHSGTDRQTDRDGHINNSLRRWQADTCIYCIYSHKYTIIQILQTYHLWWSTV